MWYILRLPCRRICVDLWLEDKDEMIWMMKIIRYIFRLTCDFWFLHLKTSGSELVWALVFELVFSEDMVLGAPVVSPLGYSINVLLILSLLIPLAHGKNIWLEFHLAHWMDLLFALEKCIWFYYHWAFHLDPHLALQILY